MKCKDRFFDVELIKEAIEECVFAVLNKPFEIKMMLDLLDRKGDEGS